jgi:AcrR family transcriptional regulator
MAKSPSTNDKILDAALRLAASRRWTEITLRDIAGEAGLSLAALNETVPSRAAILALLNRRIDQRMLAALDQDPVSGDAHDRLFEVLMRRLEVMSPYRAAVASIIADPATLLDDPPEIASSLGRSLGWVLAAAGLEDSGSREIIKRLGLAAVYRRVLGVWVEDDDPGLARTMAALDRALRDGETWLKRLAPALSLAGAFASAARALVRGRRRPAA